MTIIFKRLSTTKKGRLITIILNAMALVAMALIYAWFYRKTELGIPCVFNLVSGFKCPGCGVTRMLFSLIELDFKSAFLHNPMLLVLLPIFAMFAVKWAVSYILTGKTKAGKSETIIAVVMIIVVSAFGIVRNLPVYDELIRNICL